MKYLNARVTACFSFLFLSVVVLAGAHAAESSAAGSAKSERTGRVAIAPRFDAAGDFSDGLAAVRIGRKWGFIDRSGSLVIRPRFVEGDAPFSTKFSDGLAAVRYGDKWGFIDRTGKVVIRPRFAGDDYSPPSFSEGLSAIREGYKYGYIDKTGNFVIAPRFDKAGNFSEGAAAVQEADGRRAYIDRNGNYITAQRFRDASPFPI